MSGQISEIEMYREHLILLRKQRDSAVMEKGLAAEENKDLRENFAYDYWEQQERIITGRILSTIKLIEDLAKKQNLIKIPRSKRKPKKRV